MVSIRKNFNTKDLWVKNRHIIIGSILALIGVFDLIFRVKTCSLSDGVSYWIHDPGKSLFHLIILPISFGLWVKKYTLVRSILSIGNKFFFWFAYFTVASLLAFMFVYNEVDNYCDRYDQQKNRYEKPDSYLLPQDVWFGNREKVKEKRVKIEQLYATSFKLSKADSATLTNLKKEYKILTKNQCQHPLSEYSTYSLYSWFETAVGLFCVILILFTFFYALFVFKETDADEKVKTNKEKVLDSMTIASLFLFVWLPWRIYSDYYINIYNLKALQLVPHFLGLVIIVCVAVAIWFRGTADNRQRKIIGILISAFWPLTTLFIYFFKTSFWVDDMMSILVTASNSIIFILMISALLPVLLAILIIRSIKFNQ